MGPVRILVASFRVLAELVASDGMYGNFAGRDASRGMAKQSFDEGAFYLSPSVPKLTRHRQIC